ncbi:hypothetical protein IDH44_24965 [Paenibacillus sp. IB182496]|uniref:Uncharacterized protein n=1 Tax=Paenibacillus sabuli TaxID=2772509 RepID=A0A927GV70_9BACL|nr:hypothetical protein [Paenibacillus sabuli]MBD2848447.1 hypothetical protein [Paenibacillus sabuli]
MAEEKTVCPWCDTEIIWDEEIGPEDYCPHCENELKGYRSLSLDMEESEDSEGKASVEEYQEDQEDLLYPISDLAEGPEDEGFRHTNRRGLVQEEAVSRLLEPQEEMPECPSCRELMLETGRQLHGPGTGYVPREIGEGSSMPAEFTVVWYVCPACFDLQQRMTLKDRIKLLGKLSEGDAEQN